MGTNDYRSLFMSKELVEQLSDKYLIEAELVGTRWNLVGITPKNDSAPTPAPIQDMVRKEIPLRATAGMEDIALGRAEGWNELAKLLNNGEI